MGKQTFLRHGNVVAASERFIADILCEDGVIKAIAPALDIPAGAEVIDASGQYVFPGGGGQYLKRH